MPKRPGPVIQPGNIHYEIAKKARGINYGGMGAVQMLVKNSDWTKR
ncbi:MAG TPA: hypothetical protein HPP87_06285 [Planctomycetes bacterium]|nr:hypothetical protein [Planctomycetota bacterium]